MKIVENNFGKKKKKVMTVECLNCHSILEAYDDEITKRKLIKNGHNIYGSSEYLVDGNTIDQCPCCLKKYPEVNIIDEKMDMVTVDEKSRQ